MNPDLKRLQPYPFERLAQLKAGSTPPAHLEHIALSIGEPKHPTPGFISEAVLSHLHQLSAYPSTKGIAELRGAIADWLTRRFELPAIDPETQVLPVNGTREALFAFAQAVVDRHQVTQDDARVAPEVHPDLRGCWNTPLVLTPNPFYQIYEGAALLAGARPCYQACEPENHFIPNYAHVDDAIWEQCQLLYICSPGNPTGAVIPEQTLQDLIRLAEEHDFIIAADECYSEIYFEESAPPVGLLQAAANMGNTDYRRCVVFHSLSKRSNAPGLRSGFVAGDAEILEQFLRYRTYHGCAMPLQHQAASIQAWRDEEHVRANRVLYREKFDAVLDILDGVLDVHRPDASFYLWPHTPIPDTDFARDLFAQQNVTVLPGSYLSRAIAGFNPGANHVRMALVAPLDECVEAAERIKRFVESLGLKG